MTRIFTIVSFRRRWARCRPAVPVTAVTQVDQFVRGGDRVGLQRGLDPVEVPVDDRRDQRGVDAAGAVRVGPGPLILGQGDRHVRLDHRPQLVEQHVLRGGPDGSVKGQVGVVPADRIRVEDLGVEHLPGGGQRGHPGAGRVGQDRLDGHPVQRDARRGQVPESGGVELGHPQAPIRFEGQQALPAELAERLADRGPADLERGGQSDFGQLLARPQRAEHDAAPDLGDHGFPAGDRGDRLQLGLTHGLTLSPDCQTINSAGSIAAPRYRTQIVPPGPR